MSNEMFCYQCEQTAGGKGCTKIGVCGKDARVALLQDLLIYQLKGIGFYAQKLIERNESVGEAIDRFMADALFKTLTNVNFTAESFEEEIKKAQKIKEELKSRLGKDAADSTIAEYESPESIDLMIEDAKKLALLSENEAQNDLVSLRNLVVLGLKGIAAYAHHADVLGKRDDDVSKFFYKALSKVIDDKAFAQDLLELNMELGKVNFRCMEILDEANTSTYGNPEPTEVLITKKKGPFIVVSGHDLKDLKDLLEQTEGKGVNIYTHSEMLPCNSYPELKKYKHLVGNFGGAWYEQQKEFDAIPGCILMTTNCIQKPKESYKDRIFTTGCVGFEGINHIDEENGKKDFTPVIQKAIELGGWQEDEPEKKILIGFGHNTVLSLADKVIDAVKAQKVKHFFLIGGCDGAKPGRSYYAELAERVPEDCVILTLACGKYRFNKKNFGTIGEIPRLLDIGQCNDAYSAIKIAVALAGAFDVGINELPLTLVLSWYEQKAVAILLTLLSLGVKNIYLGPTLPAFLTGNIVNILVEKFGLKPISTVEEDLKAILGKGE